MFILEIQVTSEKLAVIDIIISEWHRFSWS